MKTVSSQSPAGKAGVPGFAPAGRPERVTWLVTLFLATAVLGTALYLGVPQQPAATLRDELPAALASRLEEGTRLFEQGQLEAAEQLYRQLIDSYPSYPQGYNNLAALHALQGDLEQARTLLEQAMATATEYSTIYRNLGAIYAELARDSYGRALQLEPTELRTQLQILDPQGAAQLVADGKSGSATKAAAAIGGISPVTQLPATGAPADDSPTPAAAPGKAEVLPATAPGTVTEPAIAVAEPESPQNVLLRWATAWASQDFDRYLAFYAADYYPPNYSSRQSWLKKRRSRIIGPAFIEVSLEEFKLLSSSTDRAEIELLQSYRNDRFQDRTRKRFELVRRDQSWVITAEHSLGAL